MAAPAREKEIAQGEFHFGYVHGDMTVECTERDGKPTAEWSWEGNDEMDPARGRGWVVQDDGTLKGMLFVHNGESFGFTAEKMMDKKAKPDRKKTK